MLQDYINKKIIFNNEESQKILKQIKRLSENDLTRFYLSDTVFQEYIRYQFRCKGLKEFNIINENDNIITNLKKIETGTTIELLFEALINESEESIKLIPVKCLSDFTYDVNEKNLTITIKEAKKNWSKY